MNEEELKTYYTLTLMDGSTIENLYVNGNNLVSATPVYRDQLVGKLGHITVTSADGNYVREGNNVYLANLMEYNGEYYICLGKITKNMQLSADVDYIAMATGISLDQNESEIALFSANSKHFELVKKYYNNGTWGIGRIGEAVSKSWITADEFEQITGQSYEGG